MKPSSLLTPRSTYQYGTPANASDNLHRNRCRSPKHLASLEKRSPLTPSPERTSWDIHTISVEPCKVTLATDDAHCDWCGGMIRQCEYQRPSSEARICAQPQAGQRDMPRHRRLENRSNHFSHATLASARVRLSRIRASRSCWHFKVYPESSISLLGPSIV